MLCTEQFEEAERLQFTAAKRIMEPVENMNTLLATQCCASQSQAAVNVLLRCCFAGVSGPQLSNASFQAGYLSCPQSAGQPVRCGKAPNWRLRQYRIHPKTASHGRMLSPKLTAELRQKTNRVACTCRAVDDRVR